MLGVIGYIIQLKITPMTKLLISKLGKKYCQTQFEGAN
jgi:hypothetical protein